MKKFIEESWLVLVLGVVFAMLLAGTQTAMLPQIRANQQQELLAAIVEVVPEMDAEQAPEEMDPQELGVDLGQLSLKDVKIYRCPGNGNTPAGWAVAATGTGFIDTIRLVVGLSATGDRIRGIKAVAHTETPGLGNKIDTKDEENFYPLQYAGKETSRPLQLVKGTAGEASQIQAITGATYSSQYVMDIVNEIITNIVPKLPAQ